jgi:hypothetical protein
MTITTISCKDLGALALEKFCPRCFWIKRRCENKLPFQIFPGIFNSIDGYTKKITNVHYEKKSSVPKWLLSFDDFVKPVKVPHFSKFFAMDSETNIQLRGAPDEIMQKNDGSYFIIDYKTAKYTDVQDELLPMYEVQLNAYAYIGNRCNFNPVSGIGLVYYEPQTDLTIDNLDSKLLESGFHMEFTGKLHRVMLDPDRIIPPLLKKVREIVDTNTIPDGLESCKDCLLLDKLNKILTS